MAALEGLWSRLAPDANGLVAAIVVERDDGRVLMLGYMNRDALAATLSTRKVTFFSRSKGRLWQKGESSGHTLELAEMRVDCDGDALLIHAKPAGPTCHTGASSCFYTSVDLETHAVGGEDDGPAMRPNHGELDALWQTILARKAGRGMTNADGKSYVRSLLDAGPAKIDAKLREEAGELGDAIVGESDERVLSEAADLLFHALVGLAARDLSIADVAAVLRKRHGQSGIDEKARR